MRTVPVHNDFKVKQTLRFFWQAARKSKKYLIPVLILQPITIFLNSYAGFWIISQVVNRLTTETIPVEQLWPTFWPYIIAFIGAAALGELVLWRIVTYLHWTMTDRASYELYRQSFDALAEQSMEFHNDRFGGSLVSQTNKFTGAFARLSDLWLFNIAPMIYAFVFTFAILGPILPWVALTLAILSAIFMLIAWVSFRSIRELNVKEAEAQNKISGQIADSITNIMAVKSFSRERYEKNRFEGYAGDARQAAFKIRNSVVKRDIWFGLIITLITSVSFIALIYGNAWFGVAVGTLLLAVTYSAQILGNLWGFNGMLRQLNRIFGDARDMSIILTTKQIVKDLPHAKVLTAKKGAITFDAMSFRHTGSRNNEALFKNFSLTIPAGQRVGLVGHSGSGKTTLTKLLLRFADIESGAITIDGTSIQDATQASLRKAIAYVPQEPLLFHRSLRDNIGYGRPDATEKDIEAAAKKANALEFIKQLPEGFDTLVGERGVKLSGGQRQRIAIARAILKDAPILVLDEATSALDSESEKLIQDALQELMKNRTSIVIAHRLSTIAKLDRIIVLEDGEIKEDGSHDGLIARGGVYAKLWAHQSGGFIEE
ncbi:TPA: ABC transporter ATP-binding protein [Candidatus Saccharibacteria bacterium]|nr:ABC transporter ATP-binding protein [Candidatus Saccharibacteria bacterium]